MRTVLSESPVLVLLANTGSCPACARSLVVFTDLDHFLCSHSVRRVHIGHSCACLNVSNSRKMLLIELELHLWKTWPACLPVLKKSLVNPQNSGARLRCFPILRSAPRSMSMPAVCEVSRMHDANRRGNNCTAGVLCGDPCIWASILKRSAEFRQWA